MFCTNLYLFSIWFPAPNRCVRSLILPQRDSRSQPPYDRNLGWSQLAGLASSSIMAHWRARLSWTTTVASTARLMAMIEWTTSQTNPLDLAARMRANWRWFAQSSIAMYD